MREPQVLQSLESEAKYYGLLHSIPWQGKYHLKKKNKNKLNP